jgi:hypothetical protein
LIGDQHFPFENQKVLNVVDEIMDEVEPDYILYNGDLCDFYQVSKFDKDPGRVDELEHDIGLVKQYFAKHEIMFPYAQRIMLNGTHEHRFEKFMWSKAAELSSFSCLTIPSLYNLKEYGIKYIPFEQGLLINGVFLILHGDIASIHSSFTAKRQFERKGGCGITNHTHRGGSYYKTNRFGIWGWWENFCLCTLNPDWIQNPDWQNGFSLIHFTDHKRFWVQQIPIIDNEALYNGKVYK